MGKDVETTTKDTGGSNISTATQPSAASTPSRPWPRCELAYTHFELGASDDRPTSPFATRTTLNPGLRKDRI